MGDATCSVEDCGEPARARGWCSTHYCRWKATGDVRADVPIRKQRPPGTPPMECSVGDCGDPVKGRGWCEAHLNKWRKYGDPLAGKRRRLYPVGTLCKIDDCDEPVLARGWCERHYARWFDRSRRGDPGDPGIRRQITGNDLARFWSKVDKNGPVSAYRPALGKCWMWTGTINDRSGYGYFTVGNSRADRRNRSAHRYSYELIVGPVPRALDVDHLCRVRNCVNPAHLEAVTRKENVRRASRALWELRDNRCAKGHEMTPENTLIICATCANVRNGRRRSLLAQPNTL